MIVNLGYFFKGGKVWFLWRSESNEVVSMMKKMCKRFFFFVFSIFFQCTKNVTKLYLNVINCWCVLLSTRPVWLWEVFAQVVSLVDFHLNPHIHLLPSKRRKCSSALCSLREKSDPLAKFWSGNGCAFNRCSVQRESWSAKKDRLKIWTICKASSTLALKFKRKNWAIWLVDDQIWKPTLFWFWYPWNKKSSFSIKLSQNSDNSTLFRSLI